MSEGVSEEGAITKFTIFPHVFINNRFVLMLEKNGVQVHGLCLGKGR